jgi:hypothetical protein
VKSLSAVLLVLLVVAGLGIAACGESQEAKASKQVCSARADIEKQVHELQGLTITTATSSQVKDNLDAIKNDLSKIEDAQSQLSGQRREQVKAANQAFKSQIQTIVANLGSDLSLSGAKTQLTAAVKDLGSAYEQSLARVSCS